jgi:hypothetical protein
MKRTLEAAFDEAWTHCIDAVTPRTYVDVMTMSPFELGRRLKQALRDELYERRRDKRRRTATHATEKER